METETDHGPVRIIVIVRDFDETDLMAALEQVVNSFESWGVVPSRNWNAGSTARAVRWLAAKYGTTQGAGGGE